MEITITELNSIIKTLRNKYSVLTIFTVTVLTLLILSSDLINYYRFLMCFNLFEYCFASVLSLALCMLFQHISNKEWEMCTVGRLSVSLLYDR